MMWPIFWPNDTDFSNPTNMRHPSEDFGAEGHQMADQVAAVVAASGTSDDPEGYGQFFPSQLTSEPVAPAPRAGTSIPIGGSTANVIPVATTDTGHSSVVHVPSLSLVVSGDVVYNQTHMWMMRSTPDTGASRARALDTVAELEADTLIAGHRHPQAADDDARRQITESRRYLADFEVALESSSTRPSFIDRMTTTHPDLANPCTLWVAAYDLLGTAS